MANGFYNNQELVDTIIVDLNNAIKEQMTGQYIQACRIVAQISQKLINLRNGIDNDLKNKDRVIENLKEQLRDAGAEITEMSPEEFVEKYGKKGGVNNGSN